MCSRVQMTVTAVVTRLQGRQRRRHGLQGLQVERRRVGRGLDGTSGANCLYTEPLDEVTSNRRGNSSRPAQTSTVGTTQVSLAFCTISTRTRMVQLPATAAIEYVAAGHSFPGGFLAGGTFVRGLMPVPPKFNAYTYRLRFLCLAS